MTYCPQTFRFNFVLDQQVGLRTQALNLRTAVAEDPSVVAHWVPVCYERDAGLLTRLPGLPSGVRGTLRGVREIRDGWTAGGGGRCDGALWATWAAKSVPDLVAAAPAFLVMDMTPVQMEAMGALYGYSRARARLGAGLKRRATERLYRMAAHLFPWNDWAAASLRDDYGVPPEKITPLLPGVDLSLFRPDPGRMDDGVTRLLFVGGDFARKGGDLLLRWARETRVDTPWELHLVTRDPVPSASPNVVVHRGVTNNSPELVRLYQQSDLFVLPTRADCFSLVGMEAMACGLPVVLSRLGGIPELVREGETGFLAEPDDYPALAARLDQLVGDAPLRRRLGENALRDARARFDCRANLGHLLAAMKGACTGAASVPITTP